MVRLQLLALGGDNVAHLGVSGHRWRPPEVTWHIPRCLPIFVHGWLLVWLWGWSSAGCQRCAAGSGSHHEVVVNIDGMTKGGGGREYLVDSPQNRYRGL